MSSTTNNVVPDGVYGEITVRDGKPYPTNSNRKTRKTRWGPEQDKPLVKRSRAETEALRAKCPTQEKWGDLTPLDPLVPPTVQLDGKHSKVVDGGFNVIDMLDDVDETAAFIANACGHFAKSGYESPRYAPTPERRASNAFTATLDIKPLVAPVLLDQSPVIQLLSDDENWMPDEYEVKEAEYQRRCRVEDAVPNAFDADSPDASTIVVVQYTNTMLHSHGGVQLRDSEQFLIHQLTSEVMAVDLGPNNIVVPLAMSTACAGCLKSLSLDLANPKSRQTMDTTLRNSVKQQLNAMTMQQKNWLAKHRNNVPSLNLAQYLDQLPAAVSLHTIIVRMGQDSIAAARLREASNSIRGHMSYQSLTTMPLAEAFLAAITPRLDDFKTLIEPPVVAMGAVALASTSLFTSSMILSTVVAASAATGVAGRIYDEYRNGGKRRTQLESSKIPAVPFNAAILARLVNDVGTWKQYATPELALVTTENDYVPYMQFVHTTRPVTVVADTVEDVLSDYNKKFWKSSKNPKHADAWLKDYHFYTEGAYYDASPTLPRFAHLVGPICGHNLSYFKSVAPDEYIYAMYRHYHSKGVDCNCPEKSAQCNACVTALEIARHGREFYEQCMLVARNLRPGSEQIPLELLTPNRNARRRFEHSTLPDLCPSGFFEVFNDEIKRGEDINKSVKPGWGAVKDKLREFPNSPLAYYCSLVPNKRKIYGRNHKRLQSLADANRLCDVKATNKVEKTKPTGFGDTRTKPGRLICASAEPAANLIGGPIAQTISSVLNAGIVDLMKTVILTGPRPLEGVQLPKFISTCGLDPEQIGAIIYELLARGYETIWESDICKNDATHNRAVCRLDTLHTSIYKEAGCLTKASFSYLGSVRKRHVYTPLGFFKNLTYLLSSGVSTTGTMNGCITTMYEVGNVDLHMPVEIPRDYFRLSHGDDGFTMHKTKDVAMLRAVARKTQETLRGIYVEAEIYINPVCPTYLSSVLVPMRVNNQDTLVMVCEFLRFFSGLGLAVRKSGTQKRMTKLEAIAQMKGVAESSVQNSGAPLLRVFYRHMVAYQGPAYHKEDTKYSSSYMMDKRSTYEVSEAGFAFVTKSYGLSMEEILALEGFFDHMFTVANTAPIYFVHPLLDKMATTFNRGRDGASVT